MTLKAKILKRAAFEGHKVNLSERANWGRDLENHRLTPLLEALAECAEEFAYWAPKVDPRCEPDSLLNLERLLNEDGEG